METSITTATNEVGGGFVLASFGSGDTEGRTQASARRGNANANATPRQISSARSRINRSSLSTRRRRQLLQEIDDNRRGRGGGVRARVLADILDTLNG